MEGYPWGGSEELWSQTALRLVAQGYAVTASLLEWTPPHPRVLNLMGHGVAVRFRPRRYPIRKQAWRRLTAQEKTPNALEIRRFMAARPPALVVFSDGGPFPPVDVLELCSAGRMRFVTIGQANADCWWPADIIAKRYRTALASALRCYFVSDATRRLSEKHIGTELSNAEIIRNPFNVGYITFPPWPAARGNGELHLACIARLEPPAKGQDILFEALAAAPWAKRRWQLHLYGEGPMRNGLERLARGVGIWDRVVFEGHVPVSQIWESNHVLVMPSRYEGLPLAIIEAMLCGRPVIATDVAGHAEVVEDGVTGFLADAPTARSIGDALERFWARRADAPQIGAAGAERIRRLVPPDPVGIFSDKLKELLENAT
jgi:glycosyltransferase involved in cell wall biosynthesis